MKTLNNNNKPTVTTSPVIEFLPVSRQNERCLVYDIRSALIDGNKASGLSLVKAWIHMVDKGTVAENDVYTVWGELCKACYTGKYASVNGRKDGKEGELMTVSSGRVKAWLYTIRRNGYKALATTGEKGVRPEEKAVKVNRKTTVKLDAETVELLKVARMLKAMNMDAEKMASLLTKVG